MRSADADARDRIRLSLPGDRRRVRGAGRRVTTLPAHPARLVTERLVLEPLEGCHAEALFAVVSDPELYRYVPGEAHASVASLRARYEHMRRGPDDARERWWNWSLALRRAAVATAIGRVEISLVDAGARALLAYGIGRAYWGAGYAFEASSAAIAYVRKTAHAKIVEAYIDTRNARSIALVERLGFERIALVPEADVIDGAVSDEYQFRLALRKDEHGTH